MFELLRANQLNIMLLLCGACGILVFLLINTRFLKRSRKAILIFLELIALFLLWFDRLAYIYSGDISQKGYIMVRVSNFAVFFLTSAIVLGFNLYLSDLIKSEGNIALRPKRLYFAGSMAVVGMLLAVISAYTDLYYYFDETNVYHRGRGFIIAYIIPVICPLLQYTVIRKYKKAFSRLIYISLVLYIFVPIICGILQIFFYGISIVNMSMVSVSIFLYIFMYLDLNNTVEHAHKIEIQNMQGEQARMQRLFTQIANAFVSAVEKKDEYIRGNAVRTAQYAKKIAAYSGKSKDECEKVYYAALLHDVGLIGIPDNVIKNDADPDKADYETMRQKPLIGEEILSRITEYPYLSQGAHYSHERYNGTGYPEGLKGEEIPEIARIIGIADAYVTMTSKKRYREARPDFVAREAMVRGAGEEFDPELADIMVKILDSETNEKASDDAPELEKEIDCTIYRERVSAGIPVERDEIRITFDCEIRSDADQRFSAPSIVLFDSYDRRTHDNEKAIKSYHYLEYGEIWFDKYSITTEARKIEEREIEENRGIKSRDGYDHFEIVAGRYEDHLRLVMRSEDYSKEVTVALSGSTNSAYIGITGENCRIRNINAVPTGKRIGSPDITRIVEPLSYIDHFESDIKNVQIDRNRSAYTEGIEIKKNVRIVFHTMSLPGASLVWHCPYIVIYSSDDGQVDGENYRKFASVTLNGENDGTDEHAENRFIMKKNENFKGWENWKAVNKKGMDCELSLERKGNRVVLKTENLGIHIENTTIIKDEVHKVYVALTGDQVALTDIRINKS